MPPLSTPQPCTLSACTCACIVFPGSACWWHAVHCCRWATWCAVQFYQPIHDTVQTKVSGVVSSVSVCAHACMRVYVCVHVCISVEVCVVVYFAPDCTLSYHMSCRFIADCTLSNSSPCPHLHPPFKIHSYTFDEIPGASVGCYHHCDCLLPHHVPLERVSASWHPRGVPRLIRRAQQGKLLSVIG